MVKSSEPIIRLAIALLISIALPVSSTWAVTGFDARKSNQSALTYPSSWPMYGFNAAHDASFRVASDPEQSASWKFAVPGDDGHVYALNAADGKLRWKFDARNQIMTTPIVAATARGRMVYVGGGNSDFVYSEAVKFAQHDAAATRGTGINGIYALDAATGKELWKVNIGSFVSMSSATVSGNRVIMAGTHPDNLYAVDADTGKLAWKAPLAAFSSSAGDCAPAAAKGIVVTQIEAADGEPGKVASEEVAVDATTGKALWTTRLGMGAVPPRNKDAVPMIHGGVVYTGSPVTKTAYALNLEDGRILWSQPLARMKAAPAVDNDHVFFALGNGTIAVPDRTSGRILNRYKSGNGGFGPQNPVIVNRTMYIGTNFGWVYAMPVADIVAGKR